jgi:hypothetical protein
MSPAPLNEPKHFAQKLHSKKTENFPLHLGTYRAVNTFRLEYKHRPVNVVYWNNSRFPEIRKQNINSLWGKYVVSLNFIAVVRKITARFKG